MKKFLCGFLVGAMLFGAIGVFAVTYVANPVDFKVLVNGEEFVSDPPALEVEGRTYLPLRAMGEALGVPVNWNEELRQAEVGETPVNQTVSEHKTYKESNDVIDFGAYHNLEFVKNNIDESGYIFYFYDAAQLNNEHITTYTRLMENNGYSMMEVEGGYAYFSYEENKDIVVLTFVDEPSTSKKYLVVTISPKTGNTETVTTGQKNALDKAKNYLEIMAFSYNGLIKQLEYDGFSSEEAKYGADNCNANWNEQAAKKAEDYLEIMAFSRSGLIEQLVYDGFTQQQAEYGATAMGY